MMRFETVILIIFGVLCTNYSAIYNRKRKVKLSTSFIKCGYVSRLLVVKCKSRKRFLLPQTHDHRYHINYYNPCPDVRKMYCWPKIAVRHIFKVVSPDPYRNMKLF